MFFFLYQEHQNFNSLSGIRSYRLTRLRLWKSIALAEASFMASSYKNKAIVGTRAGGRWHDYENKQASAKRGN